MEQRSNLRATARMGFFDERQVPAQREKIDMGFPASVFPFEAVGRV